MKTPSSPSGLITPIATIPSSSTGFQHSGLPARFLKKVPLYAAAQLSGATSAAFTLRILLDPIKELGTTSPSGPEFKALIVEIVVSFCMMFVTSAVATDTKAIGELAGIAVGSSVCITSIFGRFVLTMSGLYPVGPEPARSIGPAILLASSHYEGSGCTSLGRFRDVKGSMVI
ncbi:Aquaporin NIP2-2, partial [Cucurbita argyrosperma subsp. sororia]